VPYADAKALANALETMLAWSPEERAAYGKRGSDHVRSRFTLEQLTSKTLDVYERVLARRRNRN
jgi:glycosyltransferase involved in cell wall biosynthesis